MKTLLNALIVTASITTSAYSVTVSTQVNNSNGLDSNLVFDSSGALLPIGGGSVAIGTFTVADSDISSFGSSTELLGAFEQLGTDTLSITSADGFFTGTLSGNIDTLATNSNDPLDTQSAFILIGNGNTLASSAEFLVYKTGNSFSGAAPTGGPTSTTLVNGNGGTLLLGEFGNFNANTGATSPTAGFNTVGFTAVPEPSSAVLALLGGVALLRRRRA